MQRVSSTPATRMDVINLQEEIDSKLQQRRARETGICPERRDLYSQFTDEIVRQVRHSQNCGLEPNFVGGTHCVLRVIQAKILCPLVKLFCFAQMHRWREADVIIIS